MEDYICTLYMDNQNRIKDLFYVCEQVARQTSNLKGVGSSPTWDATFFKFCCLNLIIEV